MLWAVGNGLTTGPLVYYLAQDLGARGLALSLLLATPNLAGLLRLFAPAVIDRAGDARRACLALSLASYVLIFALPAAGVLPNFVARPTALVLLISLLCVHQLLEFLASVALWSWLADLVPLAIRGRYFARRQIWQLAFQIPIILASGYFTDAWRSRHAGEPNALLLGYALPSLAGAMCLLASLVPLVFMPATPYVRAAVRGIAWRALVAPLVDWRFVRLLAFRVWFSFANGITQAVQSTYPKRVLNLGVGDLAAMSTTMRVGQLAASRWIGPFSDRYGNRPTLVVGQACVAASLLFFLAASPATTATRWLLLGAWVLWSAYAVHNICLPNLMLKLAPQDDRPAYIAAHDALASLSHAAATVLGGFLFDRLLTREGATGGAPPIMPYTILFWGGFALRALAVPLLSIIVEPGARTWREIVAGLAARRGVQRPRESSGRSL
ncbi:MAG: MFS transporter [Planctomycetia bacterium]|nr:MFS transporter [Planctomycetia bacterium]